MNTKLAAQYRARFNKLPKNRRPETVKELRSIIRDMWGDGFTCLGTAKVLGKDHTTILHHLSVMQLDSKVNFETRSNEERELARKYRLESERRRLATAKALVEEKKELRKLQIERAKIKEQRQELTFIKKDEYLQQRAQKKEFRDKVVAMYEEGVKPEEIRRVLSIPYASALNNILRGSDKYRSLIQPRSRPVYQVSLEGKRMKLWPSLRAASISLGRPNSSSIHLAASGRCLTAYGYKWEYAE